MHVDGAFGLWAAASRTHRHLVDGLELADSWGCDAHKWLNVPYDSGLAICAHPEVHATAVSYAASYLTGAGVGAPAGADLALSSSRRARGFAVWAALRELGRDGRGRRLLRVSVSNWSTTEGDVDRSVAAILDAVRRTRGDGT